MISVLQLLHRAHYIADCAYISYPVPHKKRVLLRWQQDRDSPQSSATQPAPPARPPAVSHPWVLPGSGEAATEPSSSREAADSRNSPLFDDFSDGDEFELPEGGRKGSYGGGRREDQRGSLSEEVGSGREEEEERGRVGEGLRTPPLVEDEDSRLSAPETPPSVPHPPNEESNLSSISDTSLVSDNERMDVEPCSPPPDSTLNFLQPPAVPADTSSTVERDSELEKSSEAVAEKTRDVVLEEESVSTAVAPEPVVSSPGAPESVVVGVAAGTGYRAESEGIREALMQPPSPARGKEERAVVESTERVEAAGDGQPELVEPLAEEKSEPATKEAAPEETREGGLERLPSAEALSWKRDSLASEEGGCGSEASSPDARTNTSPTAAPSKTPGKRKVRLVSNSHCP